MVVSWSSLAHAAYPRDSSGPFTIISNVLVLCDENNMELQYMYSISMQQCSGSSILSGLCLDLSKGAGQQYVYIVYKYTYIQYVVYGMHIIVNLHRDVLYTYVSWDASSINLEKTKHKRSCSFNTSKNNSSNKNIIINKTQANQNIQHTHTHHPK